MNLALAQNLPVTEQLASNVIEVSDTSPSLSIGTGENSRLYKTVDGGQRWTLLYANPDPKGFFDSLAFWDASHGIILGDPVDGHFAIFTTSDGGETWERQKAPAALLRAAKRAREVAAQTGTEYVVIEDGELIREIPPPPKRPRKTTRKKTARGRSQNR